MACGEVVFFFFFAVAPSSESGPADVPVSTHQEVCVDGVRGDNHHHRGPSLYSTDFDLVTRVLAADGHVLPHDGKIYWKQCTQAACM